MRKIKVILAGILVAAMCAACGSGGQNASQAAAEQEAPEEQEVLAEQEEPVEQEAEAAEPEASVEQEAGSAAVAATEGQEESAPLAATEGQEESAALAATEGQEGSAAAAATEAEQEVSSELEDASREVLKSLFGAGGPLSDVLPEGTDIDGIIDTAKEQMGQANQQLEKVFGEIAEKAESESENFSEDSLKEYAETLMRRITGRREFGDDDFFASLDELIEAYNRIKDAENEYIKEYNAGLMDCGEVQIVSNDPLYQNDDIDQDEFRTLSCMIQNNYSLDEENQLRLVSSSEDVVLFTHQKGEDGSYPVKDALFAEKGDNYMSSIEAMYSETGDSGDDLQEELEASRIMALYDLSSYLDEHPDVKGIEFEGEIRTADELEKIWGDRLGALYGEDTGTEDAGSDGTSDTAAEME